MKEKDMSQTTAVDPTPTPRPAPLGELHFHRLLVAVDGSQNADLALAAALTAARRDNATLTLIAVAPDVLTDVARWPGAGTPPAQVQEDADHAMEAVLREAVERIPDDVSVTTIFRRGRPGQEIVEESRRGDYDAILLGARGVGRVGALIGSVSQHVMHHAATTVLVAHAPHPA
jgi:nucleotide-binding universal stress UspA family protein